MITHLLKPKERPNKSVHPCKPVDTLYNLSTSNMIYLLIRRQLTGVYNNIHSEMLAEDYVDRLLIHRQTNNL